MTGEQLLDLFKFLGWIAGGVVSVWKAFDYLGKRTEERSVGATAIKLLLEADVKIRQDIENLERNDESQADQIEELHKDHRELMNNVWKLLTK